MRATERELQAMSSLANDPDFKIFMGFLDTWREDETNECISAKKPKVNQGRTQVLTEIKATIDTARDSASRRVAIRAGITAQQSGANPF